MDERVKSILDERELRKEIEKAKYMLDQKLYDVEYTDSLEKCYKSISTGEYITKVYDMGLKCIRVKDNKIVFINKTTSSEYSLKLKQYKIYVPLDLSSDILDKIIEGDDKKQNNDLSEILRKSAIFFYVLAALFVVVGLVLAVDEGGFYFIPVIISSGFIVFLGLVLHALSHILTNVVSINKKIKDKNQKE